MIYDVITHMIDDVMSHVIDESCDNHVISDVTSAFKSVPEPRFFYYSPDLVKNSRN